MSKNSRPDIQVLEDRIVRLKNQLLTYKDLRLYTVTKRRLSKVAEELAECIDIIDGVVNSKSNNISSSSLSAFENYPGERPSEFSGEDDNDLLDISLISSYNPPSPQSARDIVKMYSTQLKECAESLGTSSGVIQVNQFCNLLNSWYTTRFTPKNRNPDFYFKADRICEWIDLLMLAAGYAIHNGQFLSFLQGMEMWIKELNTPKDQAYVLPYNVMKMKAANSSYCSQEAVLLEIIIKPFIFNESFYPDRIHSVRKIVIANSKFNEEDLTLNNIIGSCSKIIVTSSFDASKYQEA